MKAAHHFGHATLIDAAKGGGLMLKQTALFHQEANVRSHLRAYVRGAFTFHVFHAFHKAMKPG